MPEPARREPPDLVAAEAQALGALDLAVGALDGLIVGREDGESLSSTARRIERRCRDARDALLSLLPRASSWRRAVPQAAALLHVVSDAKEVARALARIALEHEPGSSASLVDMTALARVELAAARRAFATRDASTVEEVLALAQQVRALGHVALSAALCAPDSCADALIAYELERISEAALSICEATASLTTGLLREFAPPAAAAVAG